METSIAKFKPFPIKADIKDFEECDRLVEEWFKDTAKNLDGGELDTLIAIVRQGPLYDGDVPSKSARDTLLELNLIQKIVVSGYAMPQAAKKFIKSDTGDSKAGYSWGYQAATYLGAYVYKALYEIGRLK